MCKTEFPPVFEFANSIQSFVETSFLGAKNGQNTAEFVLKVRLVNQNTENSCQNGIF